MGLTRLGDGGILVGYARQPAEEAVKGRSTGNGACVTVHKIENEIHTYAVHPWQPADGEPVKGGPSISNGARMEDGTMIHGDRVLVSDQQVKGIPSTGNGECVTVQRIGEAQVWTDREPADGSVKGIPSNYNGECVTVQRVGPDGLLRTSRSPADGPVKGQPSSYNGECVTVQLVGPGEIRTRRTEADGPVKSSASVGDGECVTVQRYETGSIALWDSKQGDDAPRWYFHPAEWAEFIKGVREGCIAQDTLRGNGGYNNIVVADDADVEVEIIDGEYHWSFSRFPGIVHVYTRGEMHAFIYAAYTEQFTETELWDGKIMCEPELEEVC